MNAHDQEQRQRERMEERDSVIVGIYTAIELGELDISTERLLQQTADAAHCSVDRVCSALKRHS